MLSKVLVWVHPEDAAFRAVGFAEARLRYPQHRVVERNAARFSTRLTQFEPAEAVVVHPRDRVIAATYRSRDVAVVVADPAPTPIVRTPPVPVADFTVRRSRRAAG